MESIKSSFDRVAPDVTAQSHESMIINIDVWGKCSTSYLTFIFVWCYGNWPMFVNFRFCPNSLSFSPVPSVFSRLLSDHTSRQPEREERRMERNNRDHRLIRDMHRRSWYSKRLWYQLIQVSSGDHSLWCMTCIIVKELFIFAISSVPQRHAR